MLDEGLEIINRNAFSNNPNLKYISEIPSTVNSINPLAFYNDINLKEINVSSNNEAYQSIDGVVFDKKLETLVIYPSGKNASGEYYIPKGTLKIGQYAFSYSQVSNIVTPSSLRLISSYAFCETRIENITLNEGLLEVEDNGFFMNNILESINIPSTLTKVGLGTWSIASVTIAEDNSSFIMIDKCAYTRDETTIFGCYDDETTTIIIRNGVKTVGRSAYQYMYNVENIIFNDTIEHIEEYGFAENTMLKELILSSSLIYLGDYSFSYYTELESVFLPRSLKYIGEGAFASAKIEAVDYEGTMEEFANIICENNWYPRSLKQINCTNGTIVI